MDDTPQAVVRPVRLDPFAFLSNTDLHFILLLVCVLGACLWIYDTTPLWQTQKEFLTPKIALFHCSETSGVVDAQQEVAAGNPKGEADLERAQKANAGCLAPLALQDVLRMLSGLVLLVSVASVIYLVFPVWVRWRRQLEPLSVEDAPDVLTELRSLCREAELTRQPQFVWNPLNLGVSNAFTFGRLGQYSVALTGGLVTKFSTDPPAFRAIIRHELAHLHNADIDKTYFSVAIWRAFLVTSLAPFVVSLLRSLSLEEIPFYFNVSVRVLALTVLVLLTRNAVLRTREVYADVRASTWDGPMGALQRVLEHLPHPQRALWWDMVRVHPTPEKRLRALKDTWPLFQIGFWVAFGTGIAAAISFDGVTTFFFLLAEGQQSWFPSPVAAGLIFGGLATGVVGSGMWRATFAAQAQGRTLPGVGRVALGIMLGVVIGQVLSLPLVGVPPPAFKTLGSFLAAWMVWCLLLLLSLLLVLRWIVATTTTWLEVTASKSTLRWSSRLVLLVAGGVWAVWIGVLWLVGTSLLALSNFDIGFLFDFIWLILTLLIQPLVLVGLISLWAFPLAAWLWRKRLVTPTELDWAWLDQIPEQEIRSPREPFQLRLALLIGIAGGLLFCGLLLAVRLWLRITVPIAVRETETFILALVDWSNSRAALIQVAVAIVTAAWARRLGGLYGLFAAFVAGCVMTVGSLGLNLLFGGTIDLSLVLIVFGETIIPGGLLALLIAPAVATLTKWTGPALRTALLGALIYCGLGLCVTIGWQFVARKPITSDLYFSGVPILLVLFQVAVGAIVTARSTRRSWLYGLFAAFITGWVGSISALLSNFFPITSFAEGIVFVLANMYIAAIGTLLALPIVLVVLMVAGQIRRSRRQKDAGPATTTSPPI